MEFDNNTVDKTSLRWLSDDTKFCVDTCSAYDYTRAFNTDSNYVRDHCFDERLGTTIRNLDISELNHFDSICKDENGKYLNELAYNNHHLMRWAAKIPGCVAHSWGSAGKSTGRAFDGVVEMHGHGIGVEYKNLSYSFNNKKKKEFNEKKCKVEVAKAFMQLLGYAFFANVDIDGFSKYTTIKRGVILENRIDVLVVCINTPEREHTFMVKTSDIISIPEIKKSFDFKLRNSKNKIDSASNDLRDLAKRYASVIYGFALTTFDDEQGYDTSKEQYFNMFLDELNGNLLRNL